MPAVAVDPAYFLQSEFLQQLRQGRNAPEVAWLIGKKLHGLDDASVNASVTTLPFNTLRKDPIKLVTLIEALWRTDDKLIQQGLLFVVAQLSCDIKLRRAIDSGNNMSYKIADRLNKDTRHAAIACVTALVSFIATAPTQEERVRIAENTAIQILELLHQETSHHRAGNSCPELLELLTSFAALLAELFTNPVPPQSLVHVVPRYVGLLAEVLRSLDSTHIQYSLKAIFAFARYEPYLVLKHEKCARALVRLLRSNDIQCRYDVCCGLFCVFERMEKCSRQMFVRTPVFERIAMLEQRIQAEILAHPSSYWVKHTHQRCLQLKAIVQHRELDNIISSATVLTQLVLESPFLLCGNMLENNVEKILSHTDDSCRKNCQDDRDKICDTLRTMVNNLKHPSREELILSLQERMLMDDWVSISRICDNAISNVLNPKKYRSAVASFHPFVYLARGMCEDSPQKQLWLAKKGLAMQPKPTGYIYFGLLDMSIRASLKLALVPVKGQAILTPMTLAYVRGALKDADLYLFNAPLDAPDLSGNFMNKLWCHLILNEPNNFGAADITNMQRRLQHIDLVGNAMYLDARDSHLRHLFEFVTTWASTVWLDQPSDFLDDYGVISITISDVSVRSLLCSYCGLPGGTAIKSLCCKSDVAYCDTMCQTHDRKHHLLACKTGTNISGGPRHPVRPYGSP